MRILIGYDGSPGADVALDLVRSIDWPADSTIRALTVLGDDADGTTQADVEAGLKAREGPKERTSWHVDRGVAYGRPSAQIAGAAASFAADVVVLGSRGHGPIASLPLGSVSAEVAERAPCPVLIARTTEIDRVVFATDGSRPAQEAESMLAAWPIFDRATIHVVSVADLPHVYPMVPGPSMHDAALEAKARSIADEAAVRLVAAGRQPRPRVRSGDPAAQIVGLAAELGAGLIVLGSRGRLGVAGMMLGSVARNVLYSTPASVLIVRRPGPAQ
jgi:nucleotide-binding universal stress UspA family protein